MGIQALEKVSPLLDANKKNLFLFYSRYNLFLNLIAKNETTLPNDVSFLITFPATPPSVGSTSAVILNQNIKYTSVLEPNDIYITILPDLIF